MKKPSTVDSASQAHLCFPAETWSESTPEAQGLDAEMLDEAMKYILSICGEIGVSETMVVRNGFVIWKGDNVHNRHTVWSCTKSFMSTCFGLLWDDGKCSPSTLAWKFFPELEKDYPTITLEHLATFTSGYGFSGADPLQPLAPIYQPGAAFHYSAQSDLLAAILTRIAGEPLSELFMRRIGGLIGMTEDCFCWTRHGAIDGIPLNGGSGLPGSNVECSALGIARMEWLYANEGNWNGEQLISRRYVDYATVPRVQPRVPPYEPEGWYIGLPGSYGLNWWTNGIKPNGQRMWPSAPVRTFAAQGHFNNICLSIPGWRMVIVRLGGDKVIDTDLYDGMFSLVRQSMIPEPCR